MGAHCCSVRKNTENLGSGIGNPVTPCNGAHNQSSSAIDLLHSNSITAIMRLLTHNTLRNNTAEAKGKGHPLKITATEIRVDDSNTPNSTHEDAQREVAFVKGILGVLDWPTLVQGASAMGLKTLPPMLTEELAADPQFLRALYHVLMNVHLVRGMLTCPVTGREFPVTNGIANFMLEEDECEAVRY